MLLQHNNPRWGGGEIQHQLLIYQLLVDNLVLYCCCTWEGWGGLTDQGDDQEDGGQGQRVAYVVHGEVQHQRGEHHRPQLYQLLPVEQAQPRLEGVHLQQRVQGLGFTVPPSVSSPAARGCPRPPMGQSSGKAERHCVEQVCDCNVPLSSDHPQCSFEISTMNLLHLTTFHMFLLPLLPVQTNLFCKHFGALIFLPFFQLLSSYCRFQS